MRLAALALISIVTFLLAAKSHGRQVRLVRERAGHHQVVFGGSNPPFVEALWRADRLRYWPTFALVFLAVALARWRGIGPEGTGFTVFGMWFFPFVSAFTVAGLATLAASPVDGTSVTLWACVLAGIAAAVWLLSLNPTA